MTYIMPTYVDGRVESKSIYLVDAGSRDTIVTIALKNMLNPCDVSENVKYIGESYAVLKGKVNSRIARTYFSKDCVSCPNWHNGQSDEYYGCRNPTGVYSCPSFIREQSRLLKEAEKRINSVCCSCVCNSKCPAESQGSSCSSDSKKVDRFRCLNFLLNSLNISVNE